MYRSAQYKLLIFTQIILSISLGFSSFATLGYLLGYLGVFCYFLTTGNSISFHIRPPWLPYGTTPVFIVSAFIYIKYWKKLAQIRKNMEKDEKLRNKKDRIP